VPPPGFVKGDLCIVVYLEEPERGSRNVIETFPVNVGHAFVALHGYDKSGVLQSTTVGMYPTDAAASLGMQPQASGWRDDSDHSYDVSYTYVSKGPRAPSWEEMQKFLAQCKRKSYDLDDYNCTNFALDALQKSGHPKFKDPNFGRVRVTRGGVSKVVTTPAAVGQDLIDLYPAATVSPPHFEISDTDPNADTILDAFFLH
jgi:hypothetical protein